MVCEKIRGVRSRSHKWDRNIVDSGYKVFTSGPKYTGKKNIRVGIKSDMREKLQSLEEYAVFER